MTYTYNKECDQNSMHLSVVHVAECCAWRTDIFARAHKHEAWPCTVSCSVRDILNLRQFTTRHLAAKGVECNFYFFLSRVANTQPTVITRLSRWRAVQSLSIFFVVIKTPTGSLGTQRTVPDRSIATNQNTR